VETLVERRARPERAIVVRPEPKAGFKVEKSGYRRYIMTWRVAIDNRDERELG
jgi:hypothetical protein